METQWTIDHLDHQSVDRLQPGSPSPQPSPAPWHHVTAVSSDHWDSWLWELNHLKSAWEDLQLLVLPPQLYHHHHHHYQRHRHYHHHHHQHQHRQLQHGEHSCFPRKLRSRHIRPPTRFLLQQLKTSFSPLLFLFHLHQARNNCSFHPVLLSQHMQLIIWPSCGHAGAWKSCSLSLRELQSPSLWGTVSCNNSLFIFFSFFFLQQKNALYWFKVRKSTSDPCRSMWDKNNEQKRKQKA